MVGKEYYSVNEISKRFQMTTRNVRRIIKLLRESKNEYMIHKDSLNRWKVHEILLNHFKRKRSIKEKYFALTIDPCSDYSVEDIKKIMRFIYENMDEQALEINYVVEAKKSNFQNHLHCYIKTKYKRKLIDILKLAFVKINYKESEIYDLARWKQYITKDGSPIIKLNKKKENETNK